MVSLSESASRLEVPTLSETTSVLNTFPLAVFSLVLLDKLLLLWYSEYWVQLSLIPYPRSSVLPQQQRDRTPAQFLCNLSPLESTLTEAIHVFILGNLKPF